MSEITVVEVFGKIRDRLDPAADRLCELADSFPSLDSDSPAQLEKDLHQIAVNACGFRDQLDTWFPREIEVSDDFDSSDHLRSGRHDARNQLNRLFGVAQLIRISTPPEPIFSLTESLLEHLESCLSIVAESTVPGKISLHGSKFECNIPEGIAEGAHILIADDQAENREILDRLLTRCGFTMDFATNGEEAITAIENTAYDAVLLDIEMPRMDGFEVLARLRESGHLRHTPVIVVTGLQEEQDAVRCIEIGAEDFLSRPIRPALLMARLSASLEKKRLREKVFEQHFTPELARELARNPDPMKMQARQAEVTVLFCDIRRFSSISERMGASHTIDWLSGVMGEFSSVVIDHGGVLVDYTGDELMAMWGAPNEQPDHAELGCRTALEILERLPEINKKWQPIVGAETNVGIGVNTGEALVGNVGTHRKFKYGPLGTTVNLASRVQGATKYLKTSLLVTGDTAKKLPEDFPTRRLCQVRVQNIQAPVHLFELKPPQAPEDWGTRAKTFEQALEHFESRNFHQASSILGDILLASPNDGPCLQLMARVVEAMLNEGRDFSPVWTLPGK
ncbi:MAG: hypothetical protein CMO55_13295 [Verrucomicrobiales bacterium]|nr:hypothetical protein [Verrucomicrobiales bacterium]